ncbi:MAG: hypothetical protein ACREUC_19840, partial [Steroidobacteraceae bacterium]
MEPETNERRAARRRLLKSTAVALLVAITILVTIVLPAEYGIDPLRTGRLLGLDALGDAKVAGGALEVMHSHQRRPHSATIEVDLAGREELEYKATLATG